MNKVSVEIMDPRAWTNFWVTTAIILLVLVSHTEKSTASLAVVGHRAKCINEGETIAVDGIDKQKCYSCICKNGLVECYHFQTCPNLEGCHMVIDKTKDDCCNKCQGCYYNGVHHQSGTEWTEPGRPCNVIKCQAGVITKSEMKCHVPCDDPLDPPPGKCCPMCPECHLNGQVASDDRDITSGDLCVKCSCKSRKMTCTKTACPVLQCAKEDRVHDPSECCPRCRGVNSPLQAPGFCLLQKRVRKEGETVHVDQCTRCKCVNQTSICERRTCPVLDCPTDLQKVKTKGCCKECVAPAVEEVISTCTFNGVTYKEGQSWTLNSCTLCKCHGGRLSCAKTLCNTTLPCPYGTQLVRKEGECCDRCEEIKSEAVCMVFGNAHYKTFDGKMFTFQSLGKYQLASDCANRTFSIRVTNGYTDPNRTATATRRVRVKYGDVRINLGQKYRTRINGNKIAMPYKTTKVHIRIEEYLRVDLSNGVRLLWNGRGFLEVTAPAGFRNKMCGLCGNFNSNVKDDLRLRKGKIVDDTGLVKFGGSWCVGGDCTKQTNKRVGLNNKCKPKTAAKRRAENPCKYLTSTEMFNECDSKLNYGKYLDACTADMCECPHGRCYCESLMAYAEECRRLGVTVKNWERNSYCNASPLPEPEMEKRRKRKKPTQRRTKDYTSSDILRLSERFDRRNRPDKN